MTPSERDIWLQILPHVSLFVFVLGSMVGSFLNVLVWRLPQGQSIVFPGSHCPKCNRAIRPYENIPILSWLLLRGRCGGCGQSISVRYPLVEFATGVVFLVLWGRVWTAGLPLISFLPYAFLAGALFAATLIDMEHLFIPDEITYAGALAAVLFAVVFPRSRLFGSVPGLPGDDQLILGWILDAAERLFGLRAGGRPRLGALFDALVGLGFGYGILWIILETGKRLWGRRHLVFTEPAEVRMTSEEIQIGEHYGQAWEHLFFRRSDRCRLAVTDAALHLGRDEAGRSLTFPGDSEVVVDRERIVLGSESFPLREVRELTGRIHRCVVPREVMGHGDLKLMAMTGAFLGADSCVFIVMIGAFSGCLFGVARALFCRFSRDVPLPFGPFLSFGAMVWILRGSELVSWYSRLLTRLR